jgi:hypothetical protein
MNVSLSQHISILESMAQLKEEWTQPVKTSIVFFEQYYDQMIDRSALSITKLVHQSVSFVERLGFDSEEASKEEKKSIDARYKENLRAFEKSTQKNIEVIWNHDNLQKDQELLLLDGMDLFSEETASVFGLTRKELLVTAVASGAATGVGVDLLFAGSTLLLGAGVGAVIGGVSAFFAFNELSEIKVLGHTLGKRYLEMGPMSNRNFPYILLGRSIYHTVKIAKRSHAQRDVAELKMNSTFKEMWLNEDLRKSLEKYHKMFRSGKTLNVESLNAYKMLIKGVLERLITE